MVLIATRIAASTNHDCECEEILEVKMNKLLAVTSGRDANHIRLIF